MVQRSHTVDFRRRRWIETPILRGLGLLTVIFLASTPTIGVCEKHLSSLSSMFSPSAPPNECRVSPATLADRDEVPGLLEIESATPHAFVLVSPSAPPVPRLIEDLVLERHSDNEWDGTSEKRAERLLGDIETYLTTHGHPVPRNLVVLPDSRANAYTRHQREVVITTELLSQVSNRSELAFILAHELAHIALGHSRNGGITAEIDADTLALQVVKALNFNPCAGPDVLERLGSPVQRTFSTIKPRLSALHNKTFKSCG